MSSKLIRFTAGRPLRMFRVGQQAVALCVLILAAVPVLGQDWVYTTRPGDSLWRISQEHLIGVDYWRRLQEHNGIADSNFIRPGSRIRVPIAWLKQQPAPALLTQMRGSVERVTGDGSPPSAVTVGTTLQAGDRIITGDDSSATIQFADGSRVLLQSNTALSLDTMSAYGSTGMVDTRMRLHGGRIENEVLPAVGSGSRYRIITPPAVAAVRGTSFRVAFDPAAATALGEVLDGALSVSAAGVSRNVPAGFGVATKTGEPPGEPKQLLPAPDVSALPLVLPGQRIVFEWPAVQDASVYRGQVFALPGAERLIQEAVVTRPRVQWQTLPIGDFLLRLRAIDADGLEGLNADHVFRIQALALPPLPMYPEDGAAIPARALVLEWTVPPGAAAFHLQIARSVDFTDLLVDDPAVKDWRYRPASELMPGNYFWRLASVTGEGTTGPFGDARQFRIRVAPEAPLLETTSRDGNQLQLSWNRVANASAYRVQLAHDEGFTQMIVDERLSVTRYRIDRLSPGTYYLRAQAIGDDGVAGNFGAASRLEIPGWPLAQIALGIAVFIAILLIAVLRRR